MPDTKIETNPANKMFPPVKPYRSGMLQVDDLHSLYWEESGNPEGVPVLFLHGGPGAGTAPSHRQFFDPAHYRIVLYDQRGSGRSTPLGEARQNTTQLLIDDIEQLRQMMGIEDWLIFGGSWGSTLALAYGQAHPQRCTGFILRGIFLGTQAEIDWFLKGMPLFFPDEHARFVKHIPEDERGDMLAAYMKRLFSDNPSENLRAARAWSRYEANCLHLVPRPEVARMFSAAGVALGVGRLGAHYFDNKMFLSEGQLIDQMAHIQHLPGVIIQGRYDVVCPPRTAWQLRQAWPNAKFQVVHDAGHSASEPGIARALVAATERFKLTGTL